MSDEILQFAMCQAAQTEVRL